MSRMRSPWWYLRGFWNRHRVAFCRKLGGWLVNWATWKARSKLKAQGRIRVLVDSNVLAHAFTHGTAWVKFKGGGGHAARVPVHHPNSDTPQYQNIRYLAGIAHLARTGFIELVTSGELQDERLRYPPGQFKKRGIFDHSLFHGIKFTSVDGFVMATLGPSYFKLPTPGEQQQQRLKANESDPQYAALVKCLGPGNSQDAWHWMTAERHGLFCFLTMDFSFKKTVAAQSGNAAVKAMKTPVMTPAEFAARFEIEPVAPRLLSYEGAEALVLPTASMPGNTRKPKKRQWFG